MTPTGSPEASAAPGSGREGNSTTRVVWIGRFADYWKPAQVHEAMLAGRRDVVVVDARWPESYAAEHIPGAISLYARATDEKAVEGLDRGAVYVVYCWNESCRASVMGTERLRRFGLDAHELHGGLQRWKSEGYSTERG